MSEIVVKDFLEAGIHYGHRTSRWNPKMRPYIYGRRNLIHIIDVKESVRGLLRAKRYLQKVSAAGSLVLFCGTKKQAADTIRDSAVSVNMPYVDYRWLGGIFTNFRTIRSRIKRLEELDQIFSSGSIETYSKKMQSTLLREHKKMLRNLNGLRHDPQTQPTQGREHGGQGQRACRRAFENDAASSSQRRPSCSTDWDSSIWCGSSFFGACTCRSAGPTCSPARWPCPRHRMRSRPPAKIRSAIRRLPLRRIPSPPPTQNHGRRNDGTGHAAPAFTKLHR